MPVRSANVAPRSGAPRFVADAAARGVLPACQGADPMLFFPPKDAARANVARARAICRRCPLLAECMAYALSANPYELYGIWAGLTRDERLGIAGRVG